MHSSMTGWTRASAGGGTFGSSAASGRTPFYEWVQDSPFERILNVNETFWQDMLVLGIA